MTEEPDVIDMMSERELRKEFRVLVKKNISLREALNDLYDNVFEMGNPVIDSMSDAGFLDKAKEEIESL